MSVLPEPHAPDPELVRKIAVEFAETQAEVHQYEEDPASALITPAEAEDHRDTAAALAEHLSLMGVPEDKWHDLAEKKPEDLPTQKETQP